MYQLPKLPYLFQDLEPFIDTHTMGLHYHKHQQNYLNKLNELLIKNNYDYRYAIEELPYHINEFSTSIAEDIIFNLGGVLNHNLYWKSISPINKQPPQGNLKIALEKQFGTYENFYIFFKEKAMSLKGSGYTFLILKRDGTLDIITTKNQDMPQLLGYVPLLTIDLWEHAYYLNYENEKNRYIDNFKEIINFNTANNIFNSLY